MPTKPNNTTIQILQQLRHGATTAADLARAVGKSESVVREALTKLAQSGEVIINAEVKPKTFALPKPKAPIKPGDRPAAKAPKAKVEKVTSPKPIDPNSGKGNPGGAVANPQPTLELKKAACRAAGGDLTYAKRLWTATAGDKTLVLTSDELADFTIGSFCAALGVDLPPREMVAASAGAKPKA